MRLRTALLLLAIATAAPLLFLFFVSARLVYEEENKSIIESALTRNRATLEAVDAEFRGSIGVLRALSTAPSLAAKDFQRFHAESKIILQTQPSWQNVVLNSADGRQLTNARLDWGTPLLKDPIEARSFQATITTAISAVGGLTAAPLLERELGIPVRVPVIVDGKVVYVLSAVVRPNVFQQILVSQRLPENWVSGIVDREGRVVARVPAVSPGKLASPDYLKATLDSREGWYRGKTLEGADTFTAYSRSKLTGWSIGYAIPADVVLGDARRSVLLLAVGLALSMISAWIIGIWLTRRIARPIGALATAAQQIGTDAMQGIIHSDIAEVHQLAIAIAKSSVSIQERDAQLRESREELERQAIELREQNENRLRFLAMLSHELRSPLAPLTTGLGLLKLHPDEFRREATEAMMGRQVAHLSRLIDDLLDIGRIDRGQIEFRKKPTGLILAARRAAESVAPLITSRRHFLSIDMPSNDVWVDGDAVRLEQIIGNLLTNAAKYTAPDGRIKMQILSSPGQAVLTVSDTGMGFDQDDAEKLFEMFTRLPSAGIENSAGLGIGLSLAKTLVELHQGDITAASNGVGHGAVFTVTLPTIAPPSPNSDTLEVPPRRSAHQNRVVVADDNVESAEALADFLRLTGAQVAIAFDGFETLEVVKTFRPTIVFIDLTMPGLDGYEVAQRIRVEDGGETVVLVALTSMGRPADHRATNTAEFDTHLTKPAPLDAVSQLVSMTRAEAAGWLSELDKSRSRE